MKFIQVYIGELCAEPLDFKTQLNVKEGDHVVCDTKFGICLGEVVGILQSSNKATKWAFQQVDTKILADIKEMEERKAALIARLDKKNADSKRYKKYEDLAAKDPEAADMLEELIQLEGEL